LTASFKNLQVRYELISLHDKIFFIEAAFIVSSSKLVGADYLIQVVSYSFARQEFCFSFVFEGQ